MKVNQIIFLLVVGLMILPTFGDTFTLDSKGIEYTLSVNQLPGDFINLTLTIDATNIINNRGIGHPEIHAIGFKVFSSFGGENDETILNRVITIDPNAFDPQGSSTLKVGTASSLTTDPTGNQVLDTAGWYTLVFDGMTGLATPGGPYTWEFTIDAAGLNVIDPSFKAVYVDYTEGDFAFMFSSGMLTVPEPSTLILLLSGTGLLAGAARFRKKT